MTDFAWLAALRDPERGRRIVDSLAGVVGPDSFCALVEALARLLPVSPDAERALNNLERYLTAAPASLAGLLVDGAAGLGSLLQLVGTSQFFGDALVANPDFLEMLRVPLRQSPDPDELRWELQSDVDACHDDGGVLRAIRGFRQRHALRIGTNDVIRDRSLEEVTRDLSHVADAVLNVTLSVALRTVFHRFGEPVGIDGAFARCAMLAFGKLGGQELNYSSDIDLMFVYDAEGTTRGRSTTMDNGEFFGRVVGEVVRLVSAHTDRGQAYRIDLRLRPEGRQGPLARSLAATRSYYDALGRTWERQALIKIRPVAGDLALGAEFLRDIEPFVYRKYFSFSEINDVKAMKRRIEQKALKAGVSDVEVKTGRGGIRDIEFTIQFLQLLNGGDLPAVRERNTLLAMQALETAGCLTTTEFQMLDDSYRFLRRTEHRLQLLFDLQTHRLPDSPEELRHLARRMGYAERETRNAERGPFRSAFRVPRSSLDDGPPDVIDTRDLLVDPMDEFLHDYHDKTRLNRQILDHLLHSTFAATEEQAEPESDLILDPDPDETNIAAVLGRYPFRDVPTAYRHLTHLAQESVRFLSSRRCRHFLASIAPALLRAVAATPDPDMTLLNLEKVTASLGAKAVLWELFSFSPPSLKLTVDLCAGSQFLTEILITNPGMIDELLDSLVLNQLRGRDELRAELADLCRGASDFEPILHSFQNKELLRIGVRDLLGKSTVRETTLALSDVAETVLAQVVSSAQPPTACGYVILGLGKLGGREMSYHSDLDLILIYDENGPADIALDFTEFMQRVIRTLGQTGTLGRLYKVDMRLRPAGQSGSLVTPLAEFRRYYDDGRAHLWERQMLTKARPVCGDAGFGNAVMTEVSRAAFGQPWQPKFAAEIAAMREKMEKSRGKRDVKRGPGGQVDIEFIVQMFQLKHGRNRPDLCSTNSWAGLESLHASGMLTDDDYARLQSAYDYLRLVEGRLRITTNRTVDEVPDAALEQEKLARRLGLQNRAAFLDELEGHLKRTREVFQKLFDAESIG